jgi:predicted regulator of Ras-like GTPase activity (Roadblock/LC7/MglB family)
LSIDDRISILNQMLQDFGKRQTEVKGQIIIAYPAGVPIASSWEHEINPILISAISASVKLTFRNLCVNCKKGNLNRLILNSENGKVIIQNAGDHAILTTIMDRDTDIYRIAFIVRDFARKLSTAIGEKTIEGGTVI